MAVSRPIVLNVDSLVELPVGDSIDLGLTDPNADRLVFWDDSEGVIAYLTPPTNWINGTAARGTPVLLQTFAPSGAATTDIVLTSPANSGFAAYLITLGNVAPATDGAVLYGRTSTDGGSTYDAGASDYRWNWNYSTDAAGTGASGDAADSEIEMSFDIGNVDGEEIFGTIELINLSATDRATVMIKLGASNVSSVQYSVTGCGRRLAAADADAFRILMSSGNHTGTIRLYGWPDAA